MRKQKLHPSTEKLNHKQKLAAKKARITALQWLAQHFPRAFDDTSSIHPLKLGIMQDILAHADKAALDGISKSKLREAVILFTRRIEYLTCLKAREMRIDLDGQPTVLVSEEEAELAANKVKKSIEKYIKSSQKITPPTPNFTYPEVNDTWTRQPPPVSTVTVTRKSTKTYDKEAVLRLKEKMGLMT